MPLKYLIDANLPYYFSLWKGDDSIHQRDIDDTWKDKQIWDYAKENNLTIITKDSDFSDKMLLYNPPPQVIHIKLGNMKMKEFFSVLTEIWAEIQEMSEANKLVSVFKDRIEGIN
jgi:predicted nuclease of predicted toxin-antitoxin system